MKVTRTTGRNFIILTALAVSALVCCASGARLLGRPDDDGWNRLANEATIRCAGIDRCVVHLAKVFPGHWARLTIFSEVVPQAGVEKAIGRALPRFDEYCTAFVFQAADGRLMRYFQADCSDGDSHSADRRSGVGFGKADRIVITPSKDTFDVRRTTVGFLEYTVSPGEP